MVGDIDMTERLALAAADAVRERRAALENGGARNLRSIVVEIAPANAGAIIESTTYLAWRQVKRGRA